MARVKIKDLPKDTKISKEEMRKVMGGTLPIPLPRLSYLQSPPLQAQLVGVPLNLLRGAMPEPIP